MKDYDLIIVGGGVTGTALLYVLAKYSNVHKILIIEKEDGFAQVNSHPLNNAQTSHEGDTETNYSPAHALEIKDAATALRTYVGHHDVPGLFRKTSRMVLGITPEEIERLRDRFAKIRAHYPHLRFIEGDEIAVIEPKVMEDRDPRQSVAALVSSEGYAINYQLLAKTFVEDALAANSDGITIMYHTSVTGVRKERHNKILSTTYGEFCAPAVVFAAGAFSLLFAQQLGYAKDLAILPVAGNFYDGGEKLNGKVYRVQVEGMPFAEIHGDPDVLDSKRTRFGPTTKPLPLLERHRYWTIIDFFRYPILSVRGISKLCKLLSRQQLLTYILRNFCYEIPLLGSWLFLKKVREIVPSQKWSDLKKRKGAGGTRPQIFDLRTGELELGDRTLIEGGCIFNTTPSPGASVCLANAQRDAQTVVTLLGRGKYHYDAAAARRDLGLKNTLKVA